MSRQSEARQIQKYVKDGPKCKNCAYRECEQEETKWGYIKERDQRCGIGDFAVKMMAFCSKHKYINEPEQT